MEGSQSTGQSRWLALIILCTGFLMIVVDATIVNVALPSIQRDLGFTQTDLAWIVNAYLIAFAGLLLLCGRLLTEAVSWHWIFFVNLPIGVATAVLASRFIERDHALGLGEGADLLGAFLVTAALMLGVYAIIESNTYGLASLHTLIFGG